MKAPAEPAFNTPFAELAGKLREIGREPDSPAAKGTGRGSDAAAAGAAAGTAAVSRDARVVRARARGAAAGAYAASGQTAPTPATDDTATPEEPGLSEEDLFAAAIRGARPIEKAHTRIRRGASVDIDQVEESLRAIERAELADLSAAAGFDVTFSDQFVRGRGHGVSRETLADLEKGRFAVRAHLDLHGMVLEDAMHSVDAFVRERQRVGDRCVLLVTGKGRNSPGQQGVLREEVPRWLAKGPSARRVLAFVSARKCDGGEGALYVLLRKSGSGKGRIDIEVGGVGALSD